MSLVCSRCGQLIETEGPCPRCGAEAPAEDRPLPEVGPGPQWLHTTWGRILIGLILAQGLFYGLRHLLTGVLLLAWGTDLQPLAEQYRFLLILQAIQVAGLLCAGLIAGAGQSQGPVLTAIIGAVNGILAVVLRQNPAQELTIVGLYGQPVLHAAFCAVGGALGVWIWRPIPSGVPLFLMSGRKSPPERTLSLLAGKIAWFRVVAGAAFAVAGTLSATMLFQKMLDASDGRLGTTHEMQDRLITWEIKALAVLVGGALAGATTTNGFKQGLVVGLCASLFLVALQAPKPGHWLEVAGLTAVSTVSLAAVGGWFGGQLFPPVIKLDRRRGLILPWLG